MRNKKRNKVLLLVILILGITIGFAALSTTLKINGASVINKNTWNIYWDNIHNQRGVTPTTSEIVDESTDIKKNIVNFTVEFDKPGDYYEFEVDAVNAGTLDAMIIGIDSKIDDNSIISTENGALVVADPSPVPSFINYSITYADGTELGLNHLLAKADESTTPSTPTRETYKVRVEYSRENVVVSDLSTDTLTYDFSFAVTYGQSDDNAIDRNAFVMNVGDYFTLVPDASTYTVLATDTGHSIDQSIIPNELTLWRVIKLNQDGTYDAVSEYISSNTIYFNGVDGYAKYVGTLQAMAAQYAKAGYTVGTRMMGYDGQTLVIQDTTEFDGSLDGSNPSTTSTPSPMTGTGEEYDGGVHGDTLYLKDVQLVTNVYGTIHAKTVGTNSEAFYWLASRCYTYGYPGYFTFRIRYASGNPEIYSWWIRNFNTYWNDDDSTHYSVRPIITLKSDVVKASGTGIKTDPYIFE